MSTANLFGRIVTGRDVRRALEAHLKKWFPTYLAEIARIEGIDPTKLQLFRSWVSAIDMPEGRYEEDQIPACVIVVPGTLDEPARQGGCYIATWGVSIGAVVAGQDRDGTLALAEIYAAAIRGAIVQNPGLDGFASGVDWLGERYDEIPNDMLRTLAGGSVQFAVTVQSAITPSDGPDLPLVDPTLDPGPRATFTDVRTTTERV